MEKTEIEDKIKLFESQFISSIQRLIDECGSQKNLSKATGIHQSCLSGYVNGSYNFSKLTIGSLIRLFPQLQISYFDTVKENADTSDEVFGLMEKRLLKMFRRLNAEDRILAFEMFSRTFGNKYNM